MAAGTFAPVILKIGQPKMAPIAPPLETSRPSLNAPATEDPNSPGTPSPAMTKTAAQIKAMARQASMTLCLMLMVSLS